MSGFDTLSMALKNLYKRKLRTFLTVLGVIVGACAIIIMISLGLAINKGFEERMMTTPNATVINIYNYQAYYGQDRSAPVLDDEMMARITRIPKVQIATPMLQMNMSLRSVIGRYIADLQITGIYPEALPVLGYELAEGRYLTAEDEWGILFGSQAAMSYMTARERNDWRAYYNRLNDPDAKSKVDLLGDRIKLTVDWNYGNESVYESDPYYDSSTVSDETQQRTARLHNIYGVGIMAPGANWESTYYSFMNIATVQALEAEQNKFMQSQGWGRNSQTTYGYVQAYVKCTDVNAVEGVIAELTKLGFIEGESVYSPATDINNLKDTMASLQMLLGAMGVLSLFIATIGISNTMIMSTVERTKEIGIMKVIGASLRDIRKLFLLESAIIGFFGGALGVIVSYIASSVLNSHGLSFFQFIDTYNYYGQAQITQVSIIPLWLSGLSLLFAALIGLMAGFFPAQRATKLSALAAIRTE